MGLLTCHILLTFVPERVGSETGAGCVQLLTSLPLVGSSIEAAASGSTTPVSTDMPLTRELRVHTLRAKDAHVGQDVQETNFNKT